MAKCLEKISGIEETDKANRISTGAMRIMMEQNFGNSQVLLGLRRVRKGDQPRTSSQKWVLMEDEEFNRNYFDEPVDLTPDEISFLTEKGLSEYFYDNISTDPLIVDVKEFCAVSDEEEDNNIFSGTMDYSDDDETDLLAPPIKRFKSEVQEQSSFALMVEQKIPKIAYVTGAVSTSTMLIKDKEAKLLELVTEYESDPDWLFCRSLCATMKKVPAAVKNNLKFQMMELATKTMVDHLS